MKKTIAPLIFLLLISALSVSIYAQDIEIRNDSIFIEGSRIDSLNTLNLSDLGLESIPKNIADFTWVKKLDLSNNQIESIRGLSKLKSLETLIMDENPDLVAHGLNEELPKLTSLKNLSIVNSKLLFIPYAIFNMNSLDRLDLRENKIQLISFEINKLKNLLYLDLSHNEISFIDNGIQGLRKLKQLDLSFNPILNKEHLFLQLASLNRLEGLTIDYVSADQSNFKSLPIKCLDSLSLQNFDSFQDESFMTSFTSIQKLSVNGRINAEDFELFMAGLKVDTLKQLTIVNTSLEELPPSLITFRNLISLDLQTVSLTTLPDFMNRFNQLQSLSIYSENLNLNETINHLISLKQLRELKVSGMDEVFVANTIQKLSLLEILLLNAERLTELPKSIENMDKLKRVELIVNNQEIENLEYLKVEMPDCEFIIHSMVAKEKKNGLSPPLKSTDIAYDRYVVDAKKRQRILTPTGTEIRIPENAFLDKNGDIVSGKVRVECREFNDPIDMAFAGIPMTETEDEQTFRYASAGMMEFRAFQNGEELFPNPKNLAIVNYNSPFKGSEYDLFYLDPDKEAWKNIGKDSISDNDEMKSVNIELITLESITMPPRPIYPSFPYGKDKISLSTNYKKRHKTTYLYLTSNSRKRWSKRDTNNKVFSELKYFSRVKWKVDYNSKNAKEENKRIMELVDRINNFNVASNRVRQTNRNTSFRWGQLNFIEDYWIEPSENEDNFSLVLSLNGEISKIPILPLNSPKRPEVAQRKMKQIYTTYTKNLQKRREDWDKVDRNHIDEVRMYQDKLIEYEDDMKVYREAFEQKNREELEELKTFPASEENVVRSFALSSFGMYNCDIRQRMENPKPLLAKLKDESGKPLKVNKLYVLDKETNGLLTFDNQAESFFESYHTNSLIVILPGDKIAVLKSDDFNAKTLNRRDAEAMLKVYDMKNTTIAELRKDANFF